jgi:hypothetical protein
MKFNFGKPKQSKEKLYKKNMRAPSTYAKCKRDKDGFCYIDVKNSPFVLGGLIEPKDNRNEYYRLDASNKDIYSGANKGLANHTAGGSIRFSTDAAVISIRVYNRDSSTGMPHFCNRGVWGIDTYVGTGTARYYVGKMMQTFATNPEYNEGTIDLPKGVKEVQINLPLYGGINSLEIGFPKGAKLGAPTKRSVGAVAFYGSSITQGGCVSRPANSYANLVCRALDADCCNYGFSGSAMGELAVAEHIASRDLACFVMDYDYNSPSLEHLESTHEPFFKRIREIKPSLPVVFVTHPFYAEATENDKKRIAIVKKTYENALANGDKNVYFVDSSDFFTKEMRDLYAVDNLHPNDLGQFSMAETIYPVVKKAVSKSEDK